MTILLKAAVPAALLALGACATASAPAAMPEETPYLFEADSGETVEAFRGVLAVPENRADPQSRSIALHYVRFPATGASKGSPIVYLAGGPGGSGVGTARRERFPLFMAMRAYGDVIAFDQRGTGWSKTAPPCRSNTVVPLDRVLPRPESDALLRQAIAQCETFWREAGFDPRGYTTVESARDLDALRAHLGARKISLWGISYGTHLALAAAREMGPRIDRMILASAEGLDQTVKLPSETDAYFARLQAAIDADPKARAAFPDSIGLIRRVHARLEKEPAMLDLPGGAQIALGKEMMQRVASALIADPEQAAMLLSLYAAIDAGHTAPLAGLLARFVRPGEPETFELMPLAMDIASGIGEARLRRVEREAASALLGDALNHPMPHARGAMDLDLGDAFRRPPRGRMPVLLLTGTLDGRTYPAEQREAVSGMTNVRYVTVENAGHNLFMVAPEVTAAIMEFMNGEPQTRDVIVAPAPKLAP